MQAQPWSIGPMLYRMARYRNSEEEHPRRMILIYLNIRESRRPTMVLGTCVS